MKPAKTLFPGFLAALLLAACLNPVSFTTPSEPGSDPESGSQTAGGEPFTVTLVINGDGSVRMDGDGSARAAGFEGGDIKSTGVRNYMQLITVRNGELRSFSDIRQTAGSPGAEFAVSVTGGETYDFLLLMGHWERMYGTYNYKAGPPTLLAAGLRTTMIQSGGTTTVTITMYPVVVDTKFTNSGVTVENPGAGGVFSLTPGAWDMVWKATYGTAGTNPFEVLIAAQKKAGGGDALKFKNTSAVVNGLRQTTGIERSGNVITLHLGDQTAGKEGYANFNLEYAPFGIVGESGWLGHSSAYYTGVPVWIIRNGVNDQKQNSATDFSAPANWGGTKNGNGAAAFKVEAAPVTGITLNKTSLSLANKETFQLVPVFTPANATNTKVTWSTSSSSVATVSAAGLVTPNNPSPKTTETATITVTTDDGNKTATCDVTVVIPVTNIERVPTGTVYPADKYLVLNDTKYDVKPYNATYQTVEWSVKNGGGTGASFTGDKLSVSNWGTVTVTATIANGKGLTDYTQDFDILFRDRILITSLTIDDITIYISQHGGLPFASYHVQPPDADTDILWDMLYTPDTDGIIDFHKTKDVGVDYWQGLKTGKTRVWTWFRQFPNIPGCYFNLTVVP